MERPKINPDLIPEERMEQAFRTIDAAIRRLLRNGGSNERAKQSFETWQKRKEGEST